MNARAPRGTPPATAALLALLFTLSGWSAAGATPPPPQALHAEPTDATIVLTWTPSNDTTVLKYRIYRGEDNVTQTPIGWTYRSETTYVDATAKNGVTYHYRVSALNQYGEGPRSGLVNATACPYYACNTTHHPGTKEILEDYDKVRRDVEKADGDVKWLVVGLVLSVLPDLDDCDQICVFRDSTCPQDCWTATSASGKARCDPPNGCLVALSPQGEAACSRPEHHMERNTVKSIYPLNDFSIGPVHPPYGPKTVYVDRVPASCVAAGRDSAHCRSRDAPALWVDASASGNAYGPLITPPCIAASPSGQATCEGGNATVARLARGPDWALWGPRAVGGACVAASVGGNTSCVGQSSDPAQNAWVAQAVTAEISSGPCIAASGTGVARCETTQTRYGSAYSDYQRVHDGMCMAASISNATATCGECVAISVAESSRADCSLPTRCVAIAGDSATAECKDAAPSYGYGTVEQLSSFSPTGCQAISVTGDAACTYQEETDYDYNPPRGHEGPVEGTRLGGGSCTAISLTGSSTCQANGTAGDDAHCNSISVIGPSECHVREEGDCTAWSGASSATCAAEPGTSRTCTIPGHTLPAPECSKMGLPCDSPFAPDTRKCKVRAKEIGPPQVRIGEYRECQDRIALIPGYTNGNHGYVRTMGGTYTIVPYACVLPDVCI